MKRFVSFLMMLPALCSVATSAWAEGALERIRRTGAIAIGHRLSEVPFSYVSDGQVTGYSTDICLNVVEAMRSRLGLERLDVHFVPVTTATRFIMIGAGKIDLECAATTNTQERRKLATFSYPMFLSATRFLSRSQDRLEKLSDLAGRSVACTTGTINVEQLNTLNRERHLNISVILSRSYPEAFDLVRSGRASAFVTDDVLLAGLVASSADPAAFSISREAMSKPEPYGIMMPPGDAAFADLFNSEMLALFESGEMERLYDRWFNQPMPPDGRNMRLPLSDDLRAAFAAPRLYEQ